MTTLFHPPTPPPMMLARRVTVCVRCLSLCAEVAPGVFEHIGDACRECFGTPGPCPDADRHGVHELRPRGQADPVACTDPEPGQCAWCHRLLDADELPCPDHREPCCGCCEPR